MCLLQLAGKSGPSPSLLLSSLAQAHQLGNTLPLSVQSASGFLGGLSLDRTLTPFELCLNQHTVPSSHFLLQVQLPTPLLKRSAYTAWKVHLETISQTCIECRQNPPQPGCWSPKQADKTPSCLTPEVIYALPAFLSKQVGQSVCWHLKDGRIRCLTRLYPQLPSHFLH